jgi:hypothetical protein
MNKRTMWTAGAIVIALGSLQSASAQSVFNPNPPVGAPYSRPALSPYLNLLRGGDAAANYYLGVLTEYDRRYQLTVPSVPPSTAYLEPYVDDRADMDVRERQLPATGHQAGFMIYNSYYRIPNQRSFIPYNPGANNPATGKQIR